MDTALGVLASASFLEKVYLLVVGAALTGIIVRDKVPYGSKLVAWEGDVGLEGVQSVD